MAVAPTATPPVAQKFAPKLAARAAALRPTARPSTMSAASAAVLVSVNVVWTIAAVRTPRTLIQVSRTTEAIANSRCGETPTRMSPMGFGKWMIVPSPAMMPGLSWGQSTDVNRAKATATAAIVPVWITTNRVQP